MQLVIRYLGFGKRCSACGRVRETTRYLLKQGDDLLQEFLICDKCQDTGYEIDFQTKRESTTTVNERRRRIKISRKLERGVAEDIGGRVQPGSGNQDAKDDIRKVGEWRIEHKYTESTKGYRLLVESLSTVIRHANLAGEWPALVINFRKLGRKFAVVPYELFLEIVERMRA
jgi:hypothetical protein